MPSDIDDKLRERFNLLPEKVGDGTNPNALSLDEEIIEAIRVNTDLEYALNVDPDTVIDPGNAYRKIAFKLAQAAFEPTEIKKIISVYVGGETWEQWSEDEQEQIITTSTEATRLLEEEAGESTNDEFSNLPIKVREFTVNTYGIYQEVSTKSYVGEIRISSTPCIITAIGENVDNGEILYKLKIKDIRNRERTLWKTTSDLMKRADVTKLLKEGMHFKEADVNNIIEYFDIVITRNRHELPSCFAASVSGWKNDFSLFVVGNRGITADGETEVLSHNNPTAELYTQNGELDLWVQAVNQLIKYPAVRFKLYSACVPPLLKWLNIKSFVQTQQTPSGRLKTTMGLLAASVWGNPEKLQLNAESTPAGIQKTVEYCTDLPLFVDETSITDRIKDLVYLIANGVGRSKSNSEGGLVMPSTWSTVLLSTGEKPILPESALTGQQVRVVPLRDGVSEKLPALEVKQIQNAITTNYGHVGILYLQELFKEKENLTSLFNSFFSSFPVVEDITSDRAKEYYAAIALAGYLLERVFEKMGVATENSMTICKHYFNENVISNCFIPDHIRALSATYSWFNANEVYFQDEDPEHPLNHERYGWIREDKKYGTCICFIPDKLSKYLNTEIGPNTFEAVTDEWKTLDILIPKEQTDSKTGNVVKIKKNQISANGGKKQVIKVPLARFEEYLRLEKEDEKAEPTEDIEFGNDSDNGVDKVTEAPQINVNAHPSSGTGFNQVSSVTAGLDENIIIHTSGDGTGIYELMNDLGLLEGDQG
ncbi:DUF927 domain-containing protein [Methanosarcina sp. T3]|uniref:DUF927 domain-containing protein n=1 Tax=Methanosarcina sp. T3 TaxID=3439062 RepID=UPI003F85331A